jgi:hypothetical protein
MGKVLSHPGDGVGLEVATKGPDADRMGDEMPEDATRRATEIEKREARGVGCVLCEQAPQEKIIAQSLEPVADVLVSEVLRTVVGSRKGMAIRFDVFP